MERIHQAAKVSQASAWHDTAYQDRVRRETEARKGAKILWVLGYTLTLSALCALAWIAGGLF